jgi:hypothetical protein
MANDPERFSLSRWSRRKQEAARGTAAPRAEAPAAPAASAPPAAPVAAPVVEMPAELAPTAPEPLPPVETLTIDSDFTAYLQPKVDEAVKRAALKKLFSDPHFNVMDGLDIYIDDYSLPDPMPEGMLDKIASVYGRLVADEEVAAATDAPPAAAPAEAPVASADSPTTPAAPSEPAATGDLAPETAPATPGECRNA